MTTYDPHRNLDLKRLIGKTVSVARLVQRPHGSNWLWLQFDDGNELNVVVVDGELRVSTS